MVLEEILIFVHREVLIVVLDVGGAFGGAAVALATRCGRVALGVVEIFVALQYALLRGIVVAASEIVVVVACGVGSNAVVHLGTHLAFYGIEIVLVGGVGCFACIVESVESHILLLSAARVVVEGINEAVYRGHTAPHGLLGRVAVATCGEAVFKEFLAVLHNVLGHLAQVEVEVAAHIHLFVDERVEHPEFYVLYVGTLEVGGCELACDAAPTFFGVVEFAVCIEVGVEVVGASLIGVECYVQQRECGTFAVCRFLVGEELALIYLAYIVVGQLLEVALYVCGRER